MVIRTVKSPIHIRLFCWYFARLFILYFMLYMYWKYNLWLLVINLITAYIQFISQILSTVNATCSVYNYDIIFHKYMSLETSKLSESDFKNSHELKENFLAVRCIYIYTCYHWVLLQEALTAFSITYTVVLCNISWNVVLASVMALKNE